MDRGLKERLVGAAVLVALAVIFIPMLLDEPPPQHAPITESNIPERPAGVEYDRSRIVPMDPEPEAPGPPTPVAESRVEPEPAPLADAPPAPPAEEMQPATEPPLLTDELPEPATAAASAWVVQLGSFSRQENAEGLQNKLREAGYPAFVESLQQDGTTSYRVRVGPEVRRAEADKLRDQINQRFELNGIVVAYP